MRPLNPQEMCEPGNAACIARRLADFHAADIKGISRKPQVFQRILKWYTLSLMRFQHCSLILLPFPHLSTYCFNSACARRQACLFGESIQYDPLALCLLTCCKITYAVQPVNSTLDYMLLPLACLLCLSFCKWRAIHTSNCSPRHP